MASFIGTLPGAAFCYKRTNINGSRSAAQKLTLVTANRGVTYIYTLLSLLSFIMIGRDSDGGSYPQT